MSGEQTSLTTREIFRRWWPLAASWMLMGVELPFVSAIVARLVNPEINLAAYGGIVFPLSLIIESPIIMLLAASTALSKDWLSYQTLRRFMMLAGGALTLLHALVAFTPLYYVVVNGIIGAPPELVEPARTGLMIMTPWTWAIAYRRFQQGVLIRFDHSRAVTMGTLIRLFGISSVLIAGYLLQSFPGVVVAAVAVVTGVIGEAIYAGLRVKPVICSQVKAASKIEPELTFIEFALFYTPLALTSLLTLIAFPMGSAALSRMPDPIASLAVWPVVNGLLFFLSSVGFSYQEVVVALLDRPGAFPLLRAFAFRLALATTGILLLMGLTPLSTLWFEFITGLSPNLGTIAQIALLLGFARPAILVFQHGLQGMIMHGRRTRAITEAIAIGLLMTAGLFWLGVQWNGPTGIYVVVVAITLASAVQLAWLFLRGRKTIEHLDHPPHQEAPLATTAVPLD